MYLYFDKFVFTQEKGRRTLFLVATKFKFRQSAYLYRQDTILSQRFYILLSMNIFVKTGITVIICVMQYIRSL